MVDLYFQSWLYATSTWLEDQKSLFLLSRKSQKLLLEHAVFTLQPCSGEKLCEKYSNGIFNIQPFIPNFMTNVKHFAWVKRLNSFHETGRSLPQNAQLNASIWLPSRCLVPPTQQWAPTAGLLFSLDKRQFHSPPPPSYSHRSPQSRNSVRSHVGPVQMSGLSHTPHTHFQNVLSNVPVSFLLWNICI